MTNICVSKLNIIGLDNGLSPYWPQAIIWTSAGILLNFTRTDPRATVRPAEGPNSFHWKNMKLEVLSCCTKFHEPHVVLEYAHFKNNIIAMKALPSDTPTINI